MSVREGISRSPSARTRLVRNGFLKERGTEKKKMMLKINIAALLAACWTVAAWAAPIVPLWGDRIF